MNEKIILLIDDDADEHELFLAALETVCKSCTFLSARGTDEALRILDSVTPDFIFLDINMPAKDGFTCLSEIKRRENTRHIPVEMYSTSNAGRDRNTSLALGACGYIQKSSSFHELCRSVREALTSQRVIE
jgi:CheY-like chemotaxis protein